MIYLATRYTDPSQVVMQMRYMDALHATAKFTQEGHHIYSPIVHFHGIACMYDMPRDIEFWWAISKDMIERCEEVWVLQTEGWQQSIGVMREIELAEQLAIPVRYVAQP